MQPVQWPVCVLVRKRQYGSSGSRLPRPLPESNDCARVWQLYSVVYSTLDDSSVQAARLGLREGQVQITFVGGNRFSRCFVIGRVGKSSSTG